MEADQSNLSACLPKCMCASMFTSDHEYITCMLVITALTIGIGLLCWIATQTIDHPTLQPLPVWGGYIQQNKYEQQIYPQKNHEEGSRATHRELASQEPKWQTETSVGGAKCRYRDVGRFWCDDWCLLSTWQKYGITWEMPLLVLVRDYPDYANWCVQKS